MIASCCTVRIPTEQSVLDGDPERLSYDGPKMLSYYGFIAYTRRMTMLMLSVFCASSLKRILSLRAGSATVFNVSVMSVHRFRQKNSLQFSLNNFNEM